MNVKKVAGKPYGASFSASEQKAMAMEIQRQLAEYDRKHGSEIDAMILWVLHEQFGFSVNRLKKFHDSFSSSINDLLERYEMDATDNVWLCTYTLKQIGVDVEQWKKEKEGDGYLQEEFRRVFGSDFLWSYKGNPERRRAVSQITTYDFGYLRAFWFGSGEPDRTGG